jgi:nitronate monooxygenase
MTLRLPVFAAPMFLISGPDLVIAAAKAGIIGAFPTPNARTIDQLDAWMTQITGAVDGAPWCANLVTHSTNARLPEDLALIAKHKPPFVVTALGSPKPVVETVKSYGGTVIADVITPTLARKALAAGADGLACICAGAGGHTGSLSPFAFASAVRAFHQGPLVIGGGISDGAGIAGAIAAGADYVYMGTSFISAEESMAPPAYKDMLAGAGIDDLLVSSAVTGTPASWLKPSLVANGYDLADMGTAPTRTYDSGENLRGKRWAQVWSAGQGVGAVTRTEPLAAIVDRLDHEYRAACARLAGKARA